MNNGQFILVITFSCAVGTFLSRMCAAWVMQ